MSRQIYKIKDVNKLKGDMFLASRVKFKPENLHLPNRVGFGNASKSKRFNSSLKNYRANFTKDSSLEERSFTLKNMCHLANVSISCGSATTFLAFLMNLNILDRITIKNKVYYIFVFNKKADNFFKASSDDMHTYSSAADKMCLKPFSRLRRILGETNMLAKSLLSLTKYYATHIYGKIKVKSP